MTEPTTVWRAPDSLGGAPGTAPATSYAGAAVPPSGSRPTPAAGAVSGGAVYVGAVSGGTMSGGTMYGGGLSKDAMSRGAVPMRPLGLGELLDGAGAVIRAYPRPVLAMSAAVAVGSALLQLVVTLTLLGPLTNTDTATLGASSGAFQAFLGTAAVGTGLTLFIAAVTGAVLAGVVTVVASRAVLGDAITLGQAWGQARPRLGALVATALLVGFASYGSAFAGIALGALLASTGTAGAFAAVPIVLIGVAGGILLYIRWSLATAVVVLERQPIRRSLGRSTVLVRRSYLRIFGVLLLALVIAGFVGQILQLPFLLFGYNPFAGFGGTPQHLSTGAALIGAAAGALAGTVVAPFTAGVRALLYIDRRMRAEGLDITLAAQARR